MGSYQNSTAEDYNRLSKAVKLSHVIILSGLTSEQMSDGAAGDSFWDIAARGAFPDEPRYYPSPETRETVVRVLLDFERTSKRLFDAARNQKEQTA